MVHSHACSTLSAAKSQRCLSLRLDGREEPRHQPCGAERRHVSRRLAGRAATIDRIALCYAAIGVTRKRLVQATTVSCGQTGPEIIKALKHVSWGHLHGIRPGLAPRLIGCRSLWLRGQHQDHHCERHDGSPARELSQQQNAFTFNLLPPGDMNDWQVLEKGRCGSNDRIWVFASEAEVNAYGVATGSGSAPL